MTETTTPRTREQVERCQLPLCGGATVVFSSFAERLETELSAACERNGNLSVQLAAMTTEREEFKQLYHKERTQRQREVGSQEYRGNTVEYIYDKCANYGKQFDAMRAELAAARKPAKPADLPVAACESCKYAALPAEYEPCKTCQESLTLMNWVFDESATHIADTGKMVAKPAIEPLGDTEFGRAEMHDKLNEVIARVAALEGGVGK